MTAFTHDISSISLIPWHDGAFDVRVGDELVHCHAQDGGFAENETVIDAVKAQRAAQV